MEDWKDIKNYEGYYQVSSLGNVRSVSRKIMRSDGVIQNRDGRNCRVFPDAYGYLMVKLNKDGKTSIKKVHRLVYEAFCGDIPSGYEINHLDFNRKNNNCDNLECLSHNENIQHTVSAGRHFTANGNTSGSRNPNYGNRKLSAFYNMNPELAVQKQSRAGMKNGRCRALNMETATGVKLHFDYIGACADYLLSNCKVRAKKAQLCVAISRHAKSQTPYYNMTFIFD